MPRRVHIRVSGRVQGVSFRAYAQQQALSLELSGWVRNLPEGTVEILAEGDDANIQQFIQWCRQGPRWARVESLNVIEEPPAGGLNSFTIRRDG